MKKIFTSCYPNIIKFLEFFIIFLLITIGVYFMYPTQASINSKEASGFELYFSGDKNLVKNLTLGYNYEKSELSIDLTFSKKVDIETNLLFSFSNKVTAIPLMPTDNKTQIHINEINKSTESYPYNVDIKLLPDDQYKNSCRITLKVNLMHTFSSTSQYYIINCSDENVIFPVSYESIRPFFADCTFDGIQPNQSHYAYIWNDIRSDELSCPTILKISTPDLAKKSAFWTLIGTIMFTLGSSYLVNLIYSYIDKLRPHQKYN